MFCCSYGSKGASSMADQSEIDRQREINQQMSLLRKQREALSEYLGQQAHFGKSNTPVDITNSINEIRDTIRNIKETLREWGAPVEHHPDDEESGSWAQYESTYRPSEE